MSKEYYKKRLVDLRARIAREKEAKKKDNESFARMIKSASTPSAKASYRKRKIDRAASHDRTIASLKRDIENTKNQLKRCK